ncbi:MAG: hypothetical protein MHM6MM_002312 [Cercozoa sp. M6MM]
MWKPVLLAALATAATTAQQQPGVTCGLELAAQNLTEIANDHSTGVVTFTLANSQVACDADSVRITGASPRQNVQVELFTAPDEASWRVIPQDGDWIAFFALPHQTQRSPLTFSLRYRGLDPRAADVMISEIYGEQDGGFDPDTNQLRHFSSFIQDVEIRAQDDGALPIYAEGQAPENSFMLRETNCFDGFAAAGRDCEVRAGIQEPESLPEETTKVVEEETPEPTQNGTTTPAPVESTKAAEEDSDGDAGDDSSDATVASVSIAALTIVAAFLQ